jgi:hypothetical protein
MGDFADERKLVYWDELLNYHHCVQWRSGDRSLIVLSQRPTCVCLQKLRFFLTVLNRVHN